MSNNEEKGKLNYHAKNGETKVYSLNKAGGHAQPAKKFLEANEGCARLSQIPDEDKGYFFADNADERNNNKFKKKT